MSPAQQKTRKEEMSQKYFNPFLRYFYEQLLEMLYLVLSRWLSLSRAISMWSFISSKFLEKFVTDGSSLRTSSCFSSLESPLNTFWNIAWRQWKSSPEFIKGHKTFPSGRIRQLGAKRHLWSYLAHRIINTRVSLCCLDSAPTLTPSLLQLVALSLCVTTTHSPVSTSGGQGVRLQHQECEDFTWWLNWL